MKKFNKIMIIGYARHGKDTVGEILQSLGYKATSSSIYAAEKVIYPVLKQRYWYSKVEECFNDRFNHRDEWYELITEYNQHDKARLCREMIEDGYDIYVGLRNREELEAARHLYDVVVWVDATERLGLTEDTSSCTVTKDDADFIIENNGGLAELEMKVVKIFGGV